MKMNITKQTKNPFLHREEYVLNITADKNPNFVEIKQAVGKDESLTIVKKIGGNFGRESFTADVVVYDSMENKNKIEKISRKERRKIAEEAKKAVEAAKAAGGNQ